MKVIEMQHLISWYNQEDQNSKNKLAWNYVFDNVYVIWWTAFEILQTHQ